MRKILFFVFLLLGSTIACARVPRIYFISPDRANTSNEFWQSTVKLFKAATSDIGAEGRVIYSPEGDRFSYSDTIVNAINDKKKPDYVIIITRPHSTGRAFEQARKKGVKLFIINSEILGMQKKTIGLPREKYKNWIGHFTPDDYAAGGLLAECMIRSSDNKLSGNFAAINGTRESSASILRLQGLKDTLELYQNHSLIFDVFGNWSITRGEELAPILISRFPETTFIWSASDLMAEGVLNYLSTHKLDKSYIVGGIDWSKSALKRVMNGKQHCSVGGHFLEAAFAAVAIYDYHNGIDFIDDLGKTYKSHFFVSNKNNGKEIYNSIYGKSSFDFKKISKTHNKRLKNYNFQYFIK
ncbi:MAG: ABC transporter substrate-binding protein [Bacteriovoracaceae bacterium]|nr:ABC transporter substrate-binding protein [Bacteriovoracaceae bacterium]